jgi:hypothetical protein
MKDFVVFCACQSDRLERLNRHLIRFALNLAAKNISDDPAVGVRVRIDADTEGVLGRAIGRSIYGFFLFNGGQTRPGRASLRTLVHDRRVLNAMAPTIAGITAPNDALPSRKRGGACRVTRRTNAPKRPQLFAAPWPKGCPAPTKDRIENMEEDRMTYHVSRQSLQSCLLEQPMQPVRLAPQRRQRATS